MPIQFSPCNFPSYRFSFAGQHVHAFSRLPLEFHCGSLNSKTRVTCLRNMQDLVTHRNRVTGPWSLLNDVGVVIIVVLLLLLILVLSPFMSDSEGWVSARVPRRLARRCRDTPVTWSTFNIYFLILGAPALARQAPFRLLRCITNRPEELKVASPSEPGIDVFRPEHQSIHTGEHQKAPVVIFVHGGIWAWGQKEMFRPLGHALADLGFLTFVVGYNRYPQGSCFSQADEIDAACKLIAAKAGHFGGDIHRSVLLGHSSGGHICALHLLRQALSSSLVKPSFPSAFLSLCSVYDIAKHFEFESARGVADISPMRPACGDLRQFPAASPALILKQLTQEQACALPPILLGHGECDSTVPATQSRNFAGKLREAGAEVHFSSLGDQGHATALWETMSFTADGKDEELPELVQLLHRAIELGGTRQDSFCIKKDS